MSSKVIHKEQLTAFERWEIPSFNVAPASLEEIPEQDQAQQITAAELENIRQSVHNEAYATGYASGIQQATEEASRIHSLLENLQLDLNQFDGQISQSLLDLSLEVARKMVCDTLQFRPEVILKIVSEAIGNLPHFNQNAHLVLHPDDAELLRKHMGEQLAHAGWKIFTDPQITHGGCRVETAHTHIDATLESRWKNVLQTIGQDIPWQKI